MHVVGAVWSTRMTALEGIRWAGSHLHLICIASAVCYVDPDMDVDRAAGAGATCGWSGVANTCYSTGWHQVCRICTCTCYAYAFASQYESAVGLSDLDLNLDLLCGRWAWVLPY
jgi:hypothetical protein